MMIDSRRWARACATLAVVCILAACGGSRGDGTEEGGAVQINGAGATFPNPIYSQWTSEYNRLNPNVRINYQSLGSGAGIRQLINRTVFFGATDQPMRDEQLQAAPGAVLHLPTVIGSVVPIFNLPGITDLQFTGPVLADIAMGKVTRWNDPALVKLNPGVALPDMALTWVHRSDGSGTTFVWVDYLAKVSPEFKERVGVDASVNWPAGVGAKGNEGVAGLVRQTPGALGYAEPAYAKQTNISFGSVQNAAGRFVKSSPESVTAAAAAAAADMPADFRVSITNAPGEEVYPISSFTWMLFYEDPDNKTHARAMVEFMRWALTDGQRFATELGYSPLPENVVQMELEALKRIRTE